MNATALVRSLLEAEDFDPSAEVDRIMGPISMEQFRAWLDEAGLTGYQVKFADWNEKNVLVEADGVASGYYPEVSEKVSRVVDRIGAQGLPYWSIEDSRPEQDRPRRWEIGFLRSYLKESDEDFDPAEEVDRLVAPQDIFSDENIRVFIPRTFETLQHALGNGSYLAVPSPKDPKMPLTIARPEAFFTATKAYGPFYVAQDLKRPNAAGGPRGVVMNFQLGKVWVTPPNSSSEIKWKDIPNTISAEATASLQQGLGDHFVQEAKQPGKTRLAVAALTRLGRFDDAAKFGRHAARMPGMPFGQSMAVALARQKQKLRTNNRFTRLVSSMSDVVWKKHGCYMMVDDWNDLVVFFEKRDREFVEKVLSNDLEFYDSGIGVKDAFEYASEGNQQVMKQLLIGRNVETEDYTPPITADDAAGMTERELKEILTSDENEDEVDDIRNALRWAADDANRSAYETEYWNLVKGKLLDAFGDEKGKEHGEFIKHGGKDKLAIYVPYTKLEEWLNYWKEDHDYEWDGSLFDLAREYVEAIDVDTRHINASIDDDYFNEQLKEHLSQIDMRPYPDKSDPNQPELFTDDERIEAPEADAPATVSVHPPAGQEGTPSRYKHVRDKEAIGYQKAMGNDRVYWHHESLQIVRALLEDDVDPTEFVDQHMTGKDFLVKVTYADRPRLVGYVIGSPTYYGVSFMDTAYDDASPMDFKTASQMAQHVMWNESNRGAHAEVVQAKWVK